MPKFNVSPMQKAYRSKLNDVGKEIFDNVLSSAVKSADTASFVDEVGEGYDLNPNSSIQDCFNSVLLKIDWAEEDAGKNPDYFEFCKAQKEVGTPGEKVATGKKEKKPARGASKNTSEARALAVSNAKVFLTKAGKPVIISELMEKVAANTKLSPGVVYKAITMFGQGKLSVEGVNAFVVGKIGNKRSYSIK